MNAHLITLEMMTNSLTAIHSMHYLPYYSYPTVDEIDEALEYYEKGELQWEHLFGYFIWCVSFAYGRDKAWAKKYGAYNNTIEQEIRFVLTDYYDPDIGPENHANVWIEEEDEEEMEDRQAAFEYMQSILMDDSYFIYDHAIQEIVKAGQQ